MTNIQEIGKKGTAAVKKLRLQKLKNGHPFMINSKDLPENQCYIEYPDGSMVLVSMLTSARDFEIIKKLSDQEETAVRAKYNLPVR